jgi:purine-cytosine permease-like protein
VTLDTVVYLLLALFAFLLICVPNLLGYRSSSATSFAARVISFAGFLLLVIGSVLAASCLLGDCFELGALAQVLAPYLWFFLPGALVSLLGWALALAATDRRRDSRRFMLMLLAPVVLFLVPLIFGLLLGANNAGAWITTFAYLTPCVPLFILLAVPKGAWNGSSTTTTG